MTLKTIGKRYLYFGLGFLVLVIEQIPTLFLGVHQPLGVALLALVLLAVSGGALYLGKRLNLLTGLSVLKTGKSWQIIIPAFMIVRVVQVWGAIVQFLDGQSTTTNQAALENLHMNPIILVIMVVIVAPIVEELVFRGILMGRVFGSNSIVGLLLSGFLFGLIHGPTTLGAWIIYGGMGLVLATTYHIYPKLEYTIMIHMINNVLGVIIMLMSLYP